MLTAPAVLRLRHTRVKAKSQCLHIGYNNMSTVQYSNYLEVAERAAKEAAVILLGSWNQLRDVEFKGDVDLVTETDKNCEAKIISVIKEYFPDHSFIGEEGAAEAGGTDALTEEPTWIIDPLDGTTNFVHKFPFVCHCIALAINKQIVCGVVYNPILQELYSATLGGGAFLNGERIQVSATKELRRALIATEIGTLRDRESVDAIFERVCAVVEPSRSVRQCGSCAMNMCGVASGRLDAMFEIGFGGPWDVAAGAIIVTEAGGAVVDPTGVPFDVMCRRVLCGTPDITTKLADILKECKLGSNEPAPPS